MVGAGLLAVVPVGASAQQRDPLEYVGTITAVGGEPADGVFANSVRVVLGDADARFEFEIVADSEFSFTEEPDPICFRVAGDVRAVPRLDETTLDENLVVLDAAIVLSGGFADTECGPDTFFQLQETPAVLDALFEGPELLTVTGTITANETVLAFSAALVDVNTGGADGDGGVGGGQTDDPESQDDLDVLFQRIDRLLGESRIDRELSTLATEAVVCGDGGRCDQALRRAEVFADRFGTSFTSRRLLADLQAVVFLGSLRNEDGTLVVPALNHLFPTIARMAVQAERGDADAELALVELVDAALLLDEDP